MLIEKLNELELGDVQPTAHAISQQNVFREDKAEPSLPIDAILHRNIACLDLKGRTPCSFSSDAELDSESSRLVLFLVPRNDLGQCVACSSIKESFCSIRFPKPLTLTKIFVIHFCYLLRYLEKDDSDFC